MHVEDIELFFILKVLGAFVGACLLLGGRVGKDGVSVLQKMAASVLQVVLLPGRSQEGFHVCCPWWVLSY